MTNQLHQVPFDDANLEVYENAHMIDHDLETTIRAVSVARDAHRAGHPGDPEAARRTVYGPSGAAAVQATMAPFVQQVLAIDEEAEHASSESLRLAQQAEQTAERRRDLHEERVLLADGTSQTRGQVHAGHEARQRATAQRESRGDLEHHQKQPGLAVRVLLVPVLSLIEMFLLIWPVTNATWGDPRSVAYFTGLTVLFVFMNERLPRLAGLAIREEREATHAAWELTAVGATLSRDGDTAAGRAISGHADPRFVRKSERKKVLCCALVGAVIAIYAAVMATRVVRLAVPLGSLPFAVLAAALITAFTAGALIYMIHWWSRGNALGDQQREHGALLDESRALAEDLHQDCQVGLTASMEAAEEAQRLMSLADQTVSEGVQRAGIVLQKTGKILGMDSVHFPGPENLFSVDRSVRARAVRTLQASASVRSQTEALLASPHPFAPAGPAPDPWQHRAGPRRALPNVTFLDPSHLGPLHSSEPRTDTRPASRRLWWLALTVLAALGVLTIPLLVLHL
jgi:hypothetical protein